MRRNKTLLTLTALEAAIVLVVIYFEPTFGVRGALHGEATFEGRPTSYWRARLDAWIEQCGSPDDAAEWFVTANATDGIFASGTWYVLIDPQPAGSPTLWNRLRRHVLPERTREIPWAPPAVLTPRADAEPVLRELEADSRYQKLIERVRNAHHRERRFVVDVSVSFINIKAK